MREALSVDDHLSPDEIIARLQMTGGSFRVQKWLVIYNALVDPRPVSEIAKHTGLSEGTVYRIIAEYNSSGPESLEERTMRAGPVGRTVGPLRSMFMVHEKR